MPVNSGRVEDAAPTRTTATLRAGIRSGKTWMYTMMPGRTVTGPGQEPHGSGSVTEWLT